MQPFLNGERYLVRLYLLHQYDQVFTPIRAMSSQRKIPELFFYFSSVCIKEQQILMSLKMQWYCVVCEVIISVKYIDPNHEMIHSFSLTVSELQGEEGVSLVRHSFSGFGVYTVRK